jgi:hypothetical protein
VANRRPDLHLSFVDFDTYLPAPLRGYRRKRTRAVLRGSVLVGTGLLFGMLLGRSQALA